MTPSDERVTAAPPRGAAWFLDAVLPPGEHGQMIRGDLLEEFRLRASTQSPRSARAWYRRQALSLGWRYGWRRQRASRIDTLARDIRFAIRTLSRSRRFTAAAVATLTIGIGASTAIFSIVHGILLRPLPYPESDRLMWAAETLPGGGLMTVAWPNYVDWQSRVASFTGLAASREMTFTVTGLGRAERLAGRQVTSNFFDLLGISPAIGRGFLPADEEPSPVHSVLVSDAFWTRAFGRDPQVVGRTILLNGDPHTIVGVLPAGARYVRDYAIFEPLGVARANSAFLDRSNHQNVVVLGRLKPGVSEAAARAELNATAEALAREYPATNSGQGAHLEPLAARIVGPLKPVLITLIAAVGFLLLIACLNVASLLVAHGATRRHELAVRSALGCGRGRLIAQLLVESTLLASLGGLLGLGCGWALVQALLALAPQDMPRLDEVRLDMPVVLFAFAATALAGLVFGLIPAVQASAVRGQSLVVRAGCGGVSRPRLRRALLVVEIAMALVLLTGAGLMIRTMSRLTGFNPGFDSDRVLTMRYSLQGPEWQGDRRRLFHDDVLARTRAIPGVTHAALVNSLPIEGSQWGSVFIVGDLPLPPRTNLPSAAFSPVSSGYFDTLSIRLREGRLFRQDDGPGGPRVAVVNARFAARFWPNEGAVGRRLKQGWPESDSPWLEIVGVVDDVKLNGIDAETPLQVYMPLAQVPQTSVALLVKTAPDAPDPRHAILDAFAALNPNLPVYGVQTLDDLMSGAIARQRVSMAVLAVFAGVALLLAAVGLYGVVSHGVAERTREVGVRLALGATGRQVLRLFLRQGVLVTLAGMAAGLAGALALAGFLEDLLFEVEPADPMTFGVVALVLFVVAMAACYLPARRATRVNPLLALRGD